MHPVYTFVVVEKSCRFSAVKSENFNVEKIYIFHVVVQNIDCGHTLEQHRLRGSNAYSS